MEFVGYGKISESTTGWDANDKNTKRLFRKTTKWVVTEKIHGSNFCFVFDGENLKCAKRTAFLEEHEAFYNFHFVKNRLASKIHALYPFVKQLTHENIQIYVFGELFGGFYPQDENISESEPNTAIQQGIFYCPHVEFFVFDIAISTIGAYVNQLEYLNFLRTVEVCKKAKLFVVEPLFIGSYHEAMEYSPIFQTTIPDYFKLPTISDNLAEGVVIKPIENCYVPLQNRPNRFIRAIVKNKAPAFTERRSDKPIIDTKYEYNINYEELMMYEVEALVCENRLDNAISKIGPPSSQDKKRAKQILDEIVKDVMSILHTDNADEMSHLLAEQIDTLREKTIHLSKILILTYVNKQK